MKQKDPLKANWYWRQRARICILTRHRLRICDFCVRLTKIEREMQ